MIFFITLVSQLLNMVAPMKPVTISNKYIMEESSYNANDKNKFCQKKERRSEYIGMDIVNFSDKDDRVEINTKISSLLHNDLNVQDDISSKADSNGEQNTCFISNYSYSHDIDIDDTCKDDNVNFKQMQMTPSSKCVNSSIYSDNMNNVSSILNKERGIGSDGLDTIEFSDRSEHYEKNEQSLF